MNAFNMGTVIDKTFNFYGVDNNEFKLGDENETFILEAVENPSDGYRSYLECVNRVQSSGIFFHAPLAKVRVEDYIQDSFEGYQLVDVLTGHVWLRFGTENTDDYYPYFVFEYRPAKEDWVFVSDE